VTVTPRLYELGRERSMEALARAESPRRHRLRARGSSRWPSRRARAQGPRSGHPDRSVARAIRAARSLGARAGTRRAWGRRSDASPAAPIVSGRATRGSTRGPDCHRPAGAADRARTLPRGPRRRRPASTAVGGGRRVRRAAGVRRARAAALRGTAVGLAILSVACGSSGSGGDAKKEAQLTALLASAASNSPSSSATKSFIEVIKKECGQDDVGLGYFVAGTSRLINELNAKAFDIWCPDRATKYREFMAQNK
jgi:hypothetical protein